MSKHGKKYRGASEKAASTAGPRPLAEAVRVAAEAAFAKFDETLEIALRLGVDPKHADQMVRGTVVLPHGLGRSARVVVFAQGEKIREAGVFCVNILGGDQEHVCRVFASKEPDKFSVIGYAPAPVTGSPRIHDALAWIDCEIDQVIPGGDHDIVVGRVRDLDATDQHGPLVFYRGGYGRFEV